MIRELLCVLGGFIGAVGAFLISRSMEWNNRNLARTKRLAYKLEKTGIICVYCAVVIMFIGVCV